MALAGECSTALLLLPCPCRGPCSVVLVVSRCIHPQVAHFCVRGCRVPPLRLRGMAEGTRYLECYLAATTSWSVAPFPLW